MSWSWLIEKSIWLLVWICAKYIANIMEKIMLTSNNWMIIFTLLTIWSLFGGPWSLLLSGSCISHFALIFKISGCLQSFLARFSSGVCSSVFHVFKLTSLVFSFQLLNLWFDIFWILLYFCSFLLNFQVLLPQK